MDFKIVTDASYDNSSISISKQKIVFVGDVAVGKTSIINSLIDSKFKDNYEPSIGVDFSMKTIRFNDKVIKLQIWDSAGQEKYKSLIPSYVRGASIIFAVYDVTSKIFFIKDKRTFENLSNWISFTRNIEKALVIICGNKKDLENERNVTFNEATEFAKEQNCPFFEISAKTQENIKKMIYSAVIELPIFEKYKKNNFYKYENLLQELEHQNETKLNVSSSMNEISLRPNDIKINCTTEADKTVLSETQKNKKCNC